jgi:hypothetical protein
MCSLNPAPRQSTTLPFGHLRRSIIRKSLFVSLAMQPSSRPSRVSFLWLCTLPRARDQTIRRAFRFFGHATFLAPKSRFVSLAMHPSSRPRPDYTSVAATRLYVGCSDQTVCRLPDRIISPGKYSSPGIRMELRFSHHFIWPHHLLANTRSREYARSSLDPTLVSNNFLITFYRYRSLSNVGQSEFMYVCLFPYFLHSEC